MSLLLNALICINQVLIDFSIVRMTVAHHAMPYNVYIVSNVRLEWKCSNTTP